MKKGKMRINNALLFMVAIIFVSGCLGQQNFKTFVSEEGRFSVLMPGMPEQKVVNISTEIGIVPLYDFKGSHNGVLYGVSYSDYPEWYIRAAGDNITFLEEFRDAKIESVFGEMLSSIVISIDGYPGLEYYFKADVEGDIISGRSRLYLVSNRLYSVRTFSPKTKAFSSSIADFFNSFSLENANNVSELLSKVRSEKKSSQTRFPSAELWIDENKVIHRSEVKDDNGESLAWVITYNGVEVLQRNARGETQYKYFREESGIYTAYLEQFIDGQYRVISNVISYELTQNETK